jgi:hypothetical protein
MKLFHLLTLCSVFLLISFCSNAQAFLAFNHTNQGIFPEDNVTYSTDENAMLQLEKSIHLSTKNIVGKRVTLSWEIPSAIKFRNFVLQRSNDGDSFMDICLLHSKIRISKKENTTFTDVTSLDGLYYYRLAELDEAGVVKNYEPIEVVVGDISTENMIYPFATIQKIGNQDKFYIKTKNTEDLQVTVNTLSGMPIVCEYQALGTFDFMITPVAPLTEGTYIVKIKNKLGEKEYKIQGSALQEGIGF